MVLNVKVPLHHAYLHVALRLAKHMHACYAPRDPCNTFKTPVQSRGSQDGRKMACVRRQKRPLPAFKPQPSRPAAAPAACPWSSTSPTPSPAHMWPQIDVRGGGMGRHGARRARSGRAHLRWMVLGEESSPEGDPGRARTAINRTCTHGVSSAAPALIHARDSAKPAILGLRTEALGRHGERPFDGKAAAHAGGPWRIRTTRP